MKKFLFMLLNLSVSLSFFAQNPEWVNYNTSNSGMSFNSVRPIVIDESNNKWVGIVGSSGGLIKIDGVYWSHWAFYITTNSGLPSNSVRAIAIDGNGNKWIGTEGGGLAKFDDLNWTVYDSSNSGMPNNEVRSIAIDGNDNKWIGTWDAGLVKFDGTNWTVYNTLNSGLPRDYVYALAVDENDNMWIGTSRGLANFDGTTWTVYDTSNSGLPSISVRSIAIDESGNRWIGTSNGLAKFDGSNWIIYNTSNSGLPDNYITSINIDGNDNIWIGHLSSGFTKFDETNWIVYNTSNSGLPHNHVYSISIDESGNKLIGSYGGLSIYNEQGVVPVELTLFTANVFGNDVRLYWETATELNNLGFEIERGEMTYQQGIKSKRNFIKIGFVEGSGNSTSSKSYSFLDQSPTQNAILTYRLKQIDFDGTFTYSKEIKVNVENVPTKFLVYQNYPNPFNPTTTIKFTIPKHSFVMLKIFDLLGREISTIVNEEKTPGIYEVVFDARLPNRQGSNLASGIYIYQIKSGGFSTSKKFILMK